MSGGHKIVYTITDEAPMLATYAFLPVIKRFTEPLGIAVEKSDISVAARVLAHFPERLRPEQKVPDNLAELGELCKTPAANVIKLPNVSASIPQLVECIAELQSQGYDIPNFVSEPTTPAEKDIASRYAKVLGSAVNPVLREGNSDRRVAGPVKENCMKNPKKLGPWTSESKTSVAHMSEGDFFASEQSVVMPSADIVKIEFEANGNKVVLKDNLKLQQGEVLDSSFMSIKRLVQYLEKEIAEAKSAGVLLSLHLKATMMKVSDPIIFGHVVKVFYKELFATYGDKLKSVGANPNNGIGDIYDKIKALPAAEQKEIEACIDAIYKTQPDLAMVDSNAGITNLHVPSDIIVDASMPNVIRDSGKMWNKDDKLQDTKCLIPDRCYAGIYKEMVLDCKANGAFDPSTMGNVANVGLMAQKAEEYGSHDKTFQIEEDGVMRVVDGSGKVLMEHKVEKGDIWRACQTKDLPIRDWVKLAVTRARASGSPAIFWLNAARAHDRNLIAKVEAYLKEHDTSGLDISIKTPEEAIKVSMARCREGKNTISVTGNVLRDYLTDLFPILELGTSAKMLSIVPLLAGGGLYETGAGGSAPKHVQQFVKEGHLRWDSLGEYLALAVSLEDLGAKTNNEVTKKLGEALNVATSKVLDGNLSPSRKVNQIDNRGTHFYIALYWAEEMAKTDPQFADLAKELAANEKSIAEDLIKCQGSKQDIGGYYYPNPKKAEAAMRPSAKLNAIIGKDF